MKLDQYNIVINGLSTYREIAETVARAKPILINWTDNHFSEFNILFLTDPLTVGRIGHGMKESYLFVSVLRVGFFGFSIREQASSKYIGEKLGISEGVTLDAFAELINGVREQMLLLSKQ